MKKIYTSLLILLLSLTLMLAFASCEALFDNITDDALGNDTHTHSFTEKVIADEYLYTLASCTDGANYYYSCSCGEKGSETFAFGDPTSHVWVDADCDTPRTCSACLATEGDVLGHNFTEATCLSPKTCSNCYVTEGTPLEHQINDGVCVLCGNEIGAKTYTVRVIDENNAPVSGVSLIISYNESYLTVTTDDGGKVVISNMNSLYSLKAMVLSVPEAYVKPAGTVYELYEGESEIVIVLEKADASKQTYTVNVVDQNGNPVEGMYVQLCTDTLCFAATPTDQNGKHEISVEAGGVVYVKLSELAGYGLPEPDKNGYHAILSPGNTEITLVVNKEMTTDSSHAVKIVDESGMPLSGVFVYVHVGDSAEVCAMPKATDNDGKVAFLLETTQKYTVTIDVPEGYVAEARYSIELGETIITLTSSYAGGGDSMVYELGYEMYDFTFTDIDGGVHNLSEILETKDMVMLNFWFADCYYCYVEFPHLNSIYEKNGDDIEILAINDWDTEAYIRWYNSYYFGGEISIPIVRYGEASNDLSLSNFITTGYPTTVIIDRYGVVSMVIVGAIVQESYWQVIVDYFTAEDYEHSIIEDPSELFSNM